MAPKLLMVLSASIVLTLGVVHFAYTFWGTMLTPRDPALQISMSQISPVITKETTIWRCWVGFNASHSMGLILFGLVFGFLALAHGQLLFHSPFLLVIGLAMLVGFVVLCKVYFFSAPLTGISIALACYVASIALSRLAT
ncbi:MAG: LIC_13387 family protein [Terriglobales bacterium]